MRFLFALVLVLCAACAPSEPRRPEPSSLDLAPLYRATLVVLSQEGRPLCGAVRVAPRLAATAYHCAVAAAVPDDRLDELDGQAWRDLDVRGAIVNFSGYESWQAVEGSPRPVDTLEAIVAEGDPLADVAVVSVPRSPHWVDLRVGAPSAGEPVASVHHAFGLIYTYSRGRVSRPGRAVVFQDERTTVLQLSIGWGPGSSGSGAFDRRGRLVGISHTTVGTTGVGLAAPPSTIRPLLR